MNIYLVSRTDHVGYDQYDSMVVCAENEDEARYMPPENEPNFNLGHTYDKKVKCWRDSHGDKVNYCSWPHNVESLKIELIGVVPPAMQVLYKNKKVILASFNAG